MDVEELSRLGSRRASCPYYASRSALPAADLVLLPYAGLLSHVSHPTTSDVIHALQGHET
jgi:chromosome transmission fidelity protein 1